MAKKPTYEELQQRIRELENAEFERKMAVDVMQKSEERYRSFVRNFRGIAFRGNMNFTPIFFHGAVEEISGYTEREFIDGEPRWDQVIHPEDLPELFTEDEERLRSIPRYSYDREYRIVRKDGAVRWVHENIQNICDDSGKPAVVQGAIYDITDRRRAEAAFRENEEKYRTVLEANPDPVVLYDMEGKVIYFNPAFTRVFGWTIEESLGKKMDIFVPEEAWRETKMMIEKVLSGGRFSSIETCRYNKKGKQTSFSPAGHGNRCACSQGRAGVSRSRPAYYRIDENGKRCSVTVYRSNR